MFPEFSRSNSEAFRKYFFNTSWLLGERILNLVFGIVTGVMVARYLGPEKFGLINFAISFVFLFSPLASIGLESVTVKNLVSSPDKREKLLGTGFFLQLAGALTVFILIAAAVQLTENDGYTNLLIFIIAGGTLFHPFNVIDYLFQAEVRSKYVAIAKSVQSVVASSLRIALIYSGAPLLWFAMAILIESALLAAGLTVIYLKQNRSFNWKFSAATAAELLKDSFPLLFSGIAVSIYMKIDQVMIKEMLDPEALGHYAAAVRLCEGWYFIPAIITGSLFPSIVDAKMRDERLYYDRVQKLYSLMVVLSLLIATVISFSGTGIIHILFGPDFAPASAVLKIYAWASLFIFLGVASGKWLVTEKLTKISLQRAIAGCVVNISFNLLLIPWYGITGAAFATIAAHTTSGYLYDLVNHKTRVSFKMKTKSLSIYGLFK